MELAAILVGIAVAIIYYRQLDTMQQQLAEMKSSGQQTDKLIEASRYQADATRRMVGAARSEARYAADAASASVTQADTAQGMLAETQKQFRLQQRPYIWVQPGFALETGGPLSGDSLPNILKKQQRMRLNVLVVNGGKSPAFVKTTFITVVFDSRDKAIQRAKGYIPGAFSIPSPMSPDSSTFFQTVDGPDITIDLIKDLDTDKKRIYVLADIQYEDIFLPHLVMPYETPVCAKINGTGMPFSPCDFQTKHLK
jgi:hypothetical protein